MLVMRNTVRGGRRAGWVTACGTLSGLTIWALAAALGLSALLRVSHVGYDILRFCGAAYLIWLGVTSLAPFRRKSTAEPAAHAGDPGPAGAALPVPGPAVPGLTVPGLTGPGTARPG